MKHSLADCLEHVVMEHEVDDVVGGKQYALGAGQSAAATNLEEAFNLVRDSAHSHDRAGLGNGAGEGKVEMDGDAGQGREQGC